jgi:predicted acyl esterase
MMISMVCPWKTPDGVTLYADIYRPSRLTATLSFSSRTHALRLEISSSNFPRFSRNLNTGEIQARTQICFGPEYHFS